MQQERRWLHNSGWSFRFCILIFRFFFLENTNHDCSKPQLATQCFIRNFMCHFICNRMLRNLIQHGDYFSKPICWQWEDKTYNFNKSYVSWNREISEEVCTVSNLLQLNFVFRGWFNSLQNLNHTKSNTNQVRD